MQAAHNQNGLGGASFPLWGTRGLRAGLGLTPDTVAPDVVTVSGGLKRRGFDASVEESLLGEVVLPSGYEIGTMLRPRIRWAPSTANAGFVRWGFEYSWSYDGAAAPLSTTIYVDTTAGGLANASQLEELVEIEGDKHRGPGSVLLFRVFRDATDATDTYADDALLLAAGVVASDNATGRAEVLA
jgi:hypothetical protein